jgi:signal transduction histidine kinase
VAEPGKPSNAPPAPTINRALLDAVVAIGSDLDLHRVLDRIILSACKLTGATYGALGIIGDDGDLSDFITHGIDPATHEQIGELPQGRGILQLLIDDARPLRLTDLRDHPASFGFPAHHPVMTSFLGVPVHIRGQVFGNLYLTEKIGAESFTSEDELVVEALARAAGVVIENARAYELSERQRTWLEASAALHESLEQSTEAPTALQHVAAGLAAVVRAAAVVVLRTEPDGPPRLIAADGPDGTALADTIETLLPTIDRSLASAQPCLQPIDAHREALMIPMPAKVFGDHVVVVATDAGHPLLVEGSAEQRLMLTYVNQAALALDRLQALMDQEQLAVVSDRERIARDLHDLVIQRLFAIGLDLQGAAVLGSVPEGVGVRLDRAVRELDATIRDIRSSIFHLQQPSDTSLAHEAQGLVREFEFALGFKPSLRTTGPITTLVSPPVAHQAAAVLREALANISRHAQASMAAVEIRVDAEGIVLIVRDDGRGIPPDRTESGLRNMRQRATDLGGELTVTAIDPHGTELRWHVPLID